MIKFIKAFTSVCLILIMLITLTCCNSDDSDESSKKKGSSNKTNMSDDVDIKDKDNGKNEDNSRDNNESESNVSKPSKPKIENTYLQYNDFSEGLAWIKYSNTNGTFWGCIDKSGKIVFQYLADTITEVVPFSNGYAYIRYEDELKIIDKKGNICSSYVIDDNNDVVAYGDGYAFIEKYAADFDSVLYTYSICDNMGIALESFALREKEDYFSFYHFGKGVFGINLSGAWEIYFPNSEKWIYFDPYPRDTFNFKDDMALMTISYGGGHDDSDGYRGKLMIADLSGNVKEVIIPENCGWDWSIGNGGIVDGKYILYSYKDCLISYDLTDDSFVKMSETYAKKVIYDDLPKPLEFSDGYTALPMKGSDGYKYVTVFDTKWNLAFDPIKIDDGDFYPISGERLVVKTKSGTIVYDMKGETVFTSSDVGYVNISPYADNVSLVKNKSTPTYLDSFGNLLFEEIDMSNVLN